MTKKNKTIGIAALLLLLFILSFFKDYFSPDYLNSPSARFLSPSMLSGQSRLATLNQYWSFWTISIIYSLWFVLVPFMIVYLSADGKIAKYVLVCLSIILALNYLLVFINMSFIDRHIVPKMNRYFHSPVITLFLLASFKLISSTHENKRTN